MATHAGPSGDVLDLGAAKPPIQVTNFDYVRLAGVVEAFRRGGREPLVVEGLGEIAFLEDGDVVTIRGEAAATDGGTLTLGEVTGRIVPAL